MLQRAHDLADRLGGDAGIECGRVKLGMSKQHLNHPDIDVLFEQVLGEGCEPLISRQDAPLRYRLG